ncbi:DUF6318 family protein [Isoptericola sp. NEAU-Y5]|uniref:DUF6318 family protein n=1 Tax=Isoptericola luteus TaxID=2879484 RepID=A0ABS7ZIX3_9MICO|nr:DUF6318 family protein [Isoptericola sp. NEAU-Y5]MCA5894868.1 DUF6318 family protein [Isoptericola sp. NEAU-Y5]MCA5895244.1 DUF6318 family protein [Isoptericola sp. NEAU-Y5]
MPRATLAATAVGLAAVLLLAGCGLDGPEPPPAASESTTPGPSLSASPSVSPSPTSTVAPPERPAEMDDDGAAGAEAAAVYFKLLDPYIMKTGDTAEWEAMSHKTCQTCANRLEQSREIAQNGDKFHGGETHVRTLQTYEQDPSTGIWPIDLQVTTGAVEITDPAGETVFSYEKVTYSIRIEMSRVGEDWAVVGVSNLDEE